MSFSTVLVTELLCQIVERKVQRSLDKLCKASTHLWNRIMNAVISNRIIFVTLRRILSASLRATLGFSYSADDCWHFGFLAFDHGIPVEAILVCIKTAVVIYSIKKMHSPWFTAILEHGNTGCVGVIPQSPLVGSVLYVVTITIVEAIDGHRTGGRIIA